MHRDDIAVKYL